MFKEWLLRNHKCISMDDLLMITHDVESKATAVKGGNVFAITYSLVASVREIKL